MNPALETTGIFTLVPALTGAVVVVPLVPVAVVIFIVNVGFVKLVTVPVIQLGVSPPEKPVSQICRVWPPEIVGGVNVSAVPAHGGPPAHETPVPKTLKILVPVPMLTKLLLVAITRVEPAPVSTTPFPVIVTPTQLLAALLPLVKHF